MQRRERLRPSEAIMCSMHTLAPVKASQVFPEENVPFLLINIKGFVRFLIRNCSFFYLKKAWIINDFTF